MQQSHKIVRWDEIKMIQKKNIEKTDSSQGVKQSNQMLWGREGK